MALDFAKLLPDNLRLIFFHFSGSHKFVFFKLRL